MDTLSKDEDFRKLLWENKSGYESHRVSHQSAKLTILQNLGYIANRRLMKQSPHGIVLYIIESRLADGGKIQQTY
jgi:hypothetical protein